MPPVQKNRLLAIGTPLGGDVLAVRSIAVQEQLGRLFHIEAELSSENADIKLDDVVGHNVTVRINIGQNVERYFNGVVSRMAQTGNKGGYAHYHATIVPWFWFLTRTADCRIFQNKSIPDIIEEVFSGHGLTDFRPSLSGSYSPREYVVQYRETDFNFVSRLMEAEGIYYFFEHENGKHTMVLADSISAHNPYPDYGEVTFQELEKGASGREVITEWTMEKEAQPVAYALNDFDFKKPKASLRANSNVSRDYGAAQFEIYDYPGEYVAAGDGDRLTGVRLDELQSQYELLHGQANCRGIVTGSTFTLKSHPRDDQNREYLVTGASLHADAGEFASGKAEGEFFSCNFTAMDKSQQFRPTRLTPKPVVQGPQTAIVVGPSGEEIYTDEYGRVKLQFHWDRYGKSDENSSCWVRVSQEWAGKKWGAMRIPRIGQEVIVEFLEGDPDRPIVTGRVYNAEAMPPYPLPTEKTKSTVKSNSSKGGNGFNEIRFEDKKGKEQIFVHAEKDEDVRVKNDSREWVGNNRHLIVIKDQTEKVKGNKHLTVEGNRVAKIQGNQSETVAGDNKTMVSGNDHLSVQGSQKTQIGADHNLDVSNNSNNACGNDLSFKAGMNIHEKSGMNHAVEAGMTVHIKGGMSIVIEAGMEISLKAGGSFIDIGPSGVAISGAMVMINSGGSAGDGPDCSPTAPEDPDSPDSPADPDEAGDAVSGDVTDASDNSADSDSVVDGESNRIEDESDEDEADDEGGDLEVSKTWLSEDGAAAVFGDDQNNFSVGAYDLSATSGISVDLSEKSVNVNLLTVAASATALSATASGTAMGGAVKASASADVLAASGNASAGLTLSPEAADIHANVGASVDLVSAKASGQIKIPLFGHTLTLGAAASGQIGASASAQASAGYNAEQGAYASFGAKLGLGLGGGLNFSVGFK